MSVSLDNSTYGVNEDAGELCVMVTISGGRLERPVAISFSTMNGSAIGVCL